MNGQPMLGSLSRTLCLACAAQVLFVLALSAQPSESSRSAYVAELSNYLLGSNRQFEVISDGSGWRGIMLSPPGTTLPPIAIGEDLFAAGQESLGRTLAVGNFADRTILNQNGFAIRSNTSIGEVWEVIVRETSPIGSGQKPNANASQGVLFLRPNDVESATGIRYLREPSEEMQKYLYYEELVSVLLRDGDAWSYHPRLEEFSSKESALRSSLRDWELFGYRSEIGRAINDLEESALSKSFRIWSAFEHRFKSNQIRVDQHTSIPRTFFSPAPSNWLNLGSWIRAISLESPGNGISYEMAVIGIVRPWMDLDALVEGKVKMQDQSLAPISVGTPPTSNSLPAGRASTIADSLILVRNITVMGKPSEDWLLAHPLNLYAYPKSINLVGFIVRVLPEIGASK